MSTSLLLQPTPRFAAPQPPRLLDQIAQAARQRGASEPTTTQLASWVRAFILFHGKRHPRELGLPDATRFLEHVVRTEKQPLPALETARSALELLYGTVLGIDLGELPRPRPPRLLDQMSQVLRVRHYSARTEACYLHWVRQFILFHGKRHPRDQGAADDDADGTGGKIGSQVKGVERGGFPDGPSLHAIKMDVDDPEQAGKDAS